MSPDFTRALELAKGLTPTPANLSRVAEKTTPEAARWAFAQWALRERAKSKFARAAEMLFDSDGVEMATHERVAAYHASRFLPGVLVADLTAGVGADLIALARRGPAQGFELDPQRVSLARHNLAVHNLDAKVEIADALQADWPADYVFADPARRTAGRRTLDIDEFAPPPRQLAARMAHVKRGGIKLSPMLPDAQLESLATELEFVSFKGECREALVWIGSEVTASRAAVHVESGARLEASHHPARTEEPAQILYEADPAAIRAHCLGCLATHLGLTALGDSNGYLTGSVTVKTPWLTPYQVLAHHPADLRRTKAALKELNGGTPIVKSRAKVDVVALAKQLKGEGEELVLIVYPVERSLRHVIARRLP